MPIYEYECRDCGRRLETMQKVSDPPLETCSVCQGSLKKLISAPAFQFKGSGWYVTDYANKGKKGKGEKTESSSDAKGKESASGSGSQDSSSNGASKDSSGQSKASPSSAKD